MFAGDTLLVPVLEKIQYVIFFFTIHIQIVDLKVNKVVVLFEKVRDYNVESVGNLIFKKKP